MNRGVKGLAIALVLSVLLNVFLSGMLAARTVRRGPAGLAGRDRGAAPMLRPGPAEMWRRQASGLEGPRQAVESARRGVRAALTADPFDAAALEAALARLRADSSEAQMAFHRSLVSMARDMKAEDRRALGDSPWFAGPAWHGGEGHRR